MTVCGHLSGRPAQEHRHEDGAVLLVDDGVTHERSGLVTAVEASTMLKRASSRARSSALDGLLIVNGEGGGEPLHHRAVEELHAG